MKGKMIEIGATYRHYKGKTYKILCIANHSETLEPHIVYEALYEDHKIWIRPQAMFLETVMINGMPQKRFEKIA